MPRYTNIFKNQNGQCRAIIFGNSIYLLPLHACRSILKITGLTFDETCLNVALQCLHERLQIVIHKIKEANEAKKISLKCGSVEE